ncbi:5070_t:CDS:2, partial [Gigaspora rosea]
DILKTKTPIPDNFLKLEKWIQLDIPHSLMEKLDLPLGEDIPYPVYISPQVLEKKPTLSDIF